MEYISKISGVPLSKSEKLEALKGGFSLKAICQELSTFHTSTGSSLYELSYEIPLLLIFCNDSLENSGQTGIDMLSCKCIEIEMEGVVPVLIHCQTSNCFEKLLAGVGLKDLCHISDPQRRLHSAFKLSNRFGFSNSAEPKSCAERSCCDLQRGLLEGVCLLHEAEIVRFARCNCLDELDCDSFISYPSQRILRKYHTLH